MASKKQTDRKTGIHTFGDLASKKSKRSQEKPKASGGRTLARSPTNVTAEPTANDATSRRQPFRTLADRLIDANELGLSKSAKRSYESDDGDDDDYIDIADPEDVESYGKAVGGSKAERKRFLGRNVPNLKRYLIGKNTALC